MADGPESRAGSRNSKRKQSDSHNSGANGKRAKLDTLNDDFIAFDDYTGDFSNESSEKPSKRVRSNANLSALSKEALPPSQTRPPRDDLSRITNRLQTALNPVTLDDIEDQDLKQSIATWKATCAESDHLHMAGVLERFATDEKCGVAATKVLKDWAASLVPEITPLDQIKPPFVQEKIREELRKHSELTVEDVVRALASARGKPAKKYRNWSRKLLDTARWKRVPPENAPKNFTPINASQQNKQPGDADVVGGASDGEWVNPDLRSAGNTSHDTEHEIDDNASVGDRPSVSDFVSDRNYPNQPTRETTPPPLVKMQDLEPAEQLLQYRYFGITNPVALVTCLSCGDEGHVPSECPSRTCRHCGASDDHFSAACPSFIKCAFCRKRGHSSLDCRNTTSKAWGSSDSCDTCRGVDHTEEECPQLWRSFRVTDLKDIKTIPHHAMLMSCYNCGSHSHFGNDCPSLPVYVRRMLGTNEIWSSKYASQFLEQPLDNSASHNKGYRKEYNSEYSDEEREDSGQYNYQLAQLADMRDF